MATNRSDPTTTRSPSTKKRTDGKSDTSSALNDMPEPTNSTKIARIAMIDDLKFFLATAANSWDHNQSARRFPLPSGENISCVLWNNSFFITGTDIVRTLTFRFHSFGRPVSNPKKFEEGIFSDLRNLKPGTDARLEEPKSELLDMLYKNNCIRTQKKQKVFYWYSVPHDRLFLDALERDLKREKMGMEPTSVAVAEPATSFSLDSTQELFDQLKKSISLSAAATANALDDDTNGPKPQPHLSLKSTPYLGKKRNSQIMITQEQKKKNAYGALFIPSTGTKARFSTPVNSNLLSASRKGMISATQAKRSRVNSVPANMGQQQQAQLINHHYHRLSHASYMAPSSPPPARPRHRSTSSASPTNPIANDALSAFDDSQRTAFNEISQSVLSSPTSKSFGQGDLVDGVGQLEIKSPRSTTREKVLPSRSLDSNTLEKTKKIFGAHSLFEGAPNYKQRRRRASSMSSSALGQRLDHPHPLQHGGPERVRRHANCHLRTTSTPNASHNSYQLTTSSLAMAAYKAGYGPNRPNNRSIPTKPSNLMQPAPIDSVVPSVDWTGLIDNKPEHCYTCSHHGCLGVFRCSEHLDQHLRSHVVKEPFMCSMCGKRFAHQDILVQHQRTHEVLRHDQYGTNGENDDDSSQEDPSTRHGRIGDNNGSYINQQQSGSTVFTHREDFYSSHGSSDHSGNLGWSTGISESVSSSICSSRCSTLSPMQDVDFEMQDLQTSNVDDVTVDPIQAIDPSPASTSAVLPLSTINEPFSPVGYPCAQDNHSSVWPFNTVMKEESQLTISTSNPMPYLEDERYSTSSSSSPSSILHFSGPNLYQNDMNGIVYESLYRGYEQAEATKTATLNPPGPAPVTLFSSYDPSGALTNADMSLSMFQLSSHSNPCGYQETDSYNTYSFENTVPYTPYIAPMDLNMTYH
ncbi:homeodomain transcription factor ste12 [Apophysomyces sp. BC1034]|nr:homeodomain transcription factor ste12 [Apophysomyces sp. BC1015]KAG0176657.1 homeodomain transcription factor ste12 [Apophysomyces sp. BC1021]KAG0186968.1 homeodomain transcription factor ste12 [Apophysomyces sp. BC1034]